MKSETSLAVTEITHLSELIENLIANKPEKERKQNIQSLPLEDRILG